MIETLPQAFLEIFTRLDLFLWVFGGALIGLILGILPGVGATMALAVLLPLTYTLEPVIAVSFLLAVYSASAFGGAVPAVLLGIPGTAQAIATQLDGYPMMKQGRGGEALTYATVASAVGGIMGLAVLMLFAPIIAGLAYNLQSAEYAALTILALALMAHVASGSMLTGLVSGVFGLLIGTVGMDAMTFTPRLDFGLDELRAGIDIVPVIVGVFGLAEILRTLQSASGMTPKVEKANITRIFPPWKEFLRTFPANIRGGLIGIFVGTLPAVGTPVAVAMAYAQEKQVSKTPERFGKGAPESIVAVESCNNAAAGGALIPTFTLGIPGNPVVAILLGALIVHGMTPGPRLLHDEPLFVTTTFLTLGVSTILTAAIMLLMIRYLILVVNLPERILVPCVAVLAVVGSFAVNNATFDIWLMILFGAIGYGMIIANVSAAPLIFGVVLGPILESNFRRTLMVSGGDPWVFVTRPISLTILIISALVLVWPMVSPLLRRWSQQKSLVTKGSQNG